MRVSNHPANDPREPITEARLGRCLVEGDPETMSHARQMRRKAFGMSMTLELTLLAVLVAAPIFTSVAKPELQNLLPPGIVFVGSWHSPTRVQQVEVGNARHTSIIRDIFFHPAGTSAPVRSQAGEDGVEGPDLDSEGGYVPGGTGLAALAPAAPLEPPRPERAEASKQPERRPLKVSPGVLEAQMISRVEPRYPPLAVLARKEGTVVLHAIISREGRITALEVVSGSPLLIQAALDAVRQWRYRPTMLGGEPVEVETTITVVFRLRS